MNWYNEVYILLTFSVLGLHVSYGYIQLNFNEDRDSICHKTETLNYHDNSGLLVNLTPSYGDFTCLFRINYPLGTDGIIAVIQSLSLRKNDTTGECIDFIQFKTKDGPKSQKFCGNFNLHSTMANEPNNLDIINYENSFVTLKEHKLYVSVTIGKHFLKSKDNTKLQVVFTSYKNCSLQQIDLTYRPCKERSNFCIYNGFFNDNYVNCPLSGCVDEGSCMKFKSVMNPLTVGSKLLVGSISFLLILFIMFLISVWACKKHKVICFSDEFSHPNRPRQVHVTELSEQTIEETQRHSVPDLHKDLPPKYEDLFPDR